MPLFRLKILSIYAITALFLAFSLPTSVYAQANESLVQDDGEAVGGSGLPVPRFVSLKFEEVNLRTGPGRRYPIRWVYKRKGAPVEVIEEFGHWRRLRDVEGDEGWAHKSQLAGARMAVFHADTTLRRYPELQAPPMIRVQKGVIAQLLECDLQWCSVQVQSYKSWVPKESIWGVYPRELL